MDLSKLKAAFPDFDVSTLPVIPDSWEDASWVNDACPCFYPVEGITVYVDYADPALRDEELRNVPRFSVDTWVSDGNVFATDDWDEILKKVEEIEKEGLTP